MTASLPTPGGSIGTWGDDLNAWLRVGHNADGTTIDSGSLPLDPRAEGGLQGPANLSEIAGGSSYYGPAGILEQLADGSYLLITRKGGGHPANGSAASLIKKTCAAGSDPSQAANWSADVTVLASGGNDKATVAGGTDSTGRTHVFYTEVSTTGGHAKISLSYIYSDDRTTWSTAVTLDVGSYTDYNAYGALVESDNGTLEQTWYGVTGENYGSFVMTSTDHGATWTMRAQTISFDAALSYDETSMVDIGGGRRIALARSATASYFQQAIRAADGTWTRQGNATFDSFTTKTPAWLQTYTAPNGVLMVRCYWCNRDTLLVRYIDCPAESLYTTGPAAWTTVGYGPFNIAAPASADSGYPRVIHPTGDYHGYGWFYETKAYENAPADMEFFALPANINKALAQLARVLTPAFPGKTDSTKPNPALSAGYGSSLQILSALLLQSNLQLQVAANAFIGIVQHSSAPGTPTSGIRLYLKSDGLYYKDTSGVEHKFTTS